MDSNKDYFEIRMLLVGAELLERLIVEEGVYLLYGNIKGGRGKYYIEVFSPNNVSSPASARFLTDLNRLFEYALEIENPYRPQMPDSI